MLDHLISIWHATFGASAPEVIIRAPGRVNIIGEHTDYNEGWVMPGAMSRSIFILIARSAHKHHWVALDLQEVIEFDADGSVPDTGPYWTKYIEGAIRMYDASLGPLKMVIGGDLPVGAGISSSSALVCGLLYAFHELVDGKESKQELAQLGSRVEREIIGLQGGIMDQYAIMLSQKDKVMILDCRTKEMDYIPALLPGCHWVLLNTRVKHQLIDSDYNQRANQCRQAVAVVQKQYPEVRSLRDVTDEMLSNVDMPEVLLRRSRFVLEENNRVFLMKLALEENDAISAGRLLKESHAGLQYEYEVSCDELDHLASLANQSDGVYGGRMMGGGFGGCVLCLVSEAAMDGFLGAACDSYENRFGFRPEVIPFSLDAGVERIR